MIVELLAIFSCAVLLCLAIFQSLLSTGYPLGRFAWGGRHDVLPTKLRIGSAISILLYIFFAVIILSAAGVANIISNEQLTSIAIWVLVAYFFLGVFMNGISQSKLERAVMTPVALCLALSCLLIAIIN